MYQYPNQHITLDSELLKQAMDQSQPDTQDLATTLNQTLLTYINKSRLETMGYTETLFQLEKATSVKVFAKQILSHITQRKLEEFYKNPHFCGIVYPDTRTDIYLTPKSNLIVLKSITLSILFRNGVIIQEEQMDRVIGCKILYPSRATIEQFDLPKDQTELIFATIQSQEIRSALHPTFYESLEY